MNVKQWMESLREARVKKSMPVLSFPCITLLDVSVRELISDPALQAKGMKMVADRIPSAASVSMMDLSVEAEAFGAQVRFSDDEVPTVIGAIAGTMEEAEALKVPAVGAGRTGLYVQALGEAAKLIEDRPVFAGIIGPFSLAGRLMDVTETMMLCYDEPEQVHMVLRKATDFLIEYARAYRDAGADGIVMAEPLTGLLSPDLAEEFSEPYVREIVEAVQTETFGVIYHNCGNGAIRQIDSILRVGAMAYHFGNAIDMEEMMTHIPPEVVAMGNVDPAAQVRNGTPESIRKETLRVMGKCCKYPNFVISSGCDIPPLTPWKNIDAYFAAIEEFYQKN